MPSGIDGALASLKLGGDSLPARAKVTYDGFAKEKKLPAPCDIDPQALGVEACSKIIKQQEFLIKNLKTKSAATIPSKKNKPEIAQMKENLEMLIGDGNYKAALSFVRNLEEADREAAREERDKEELAAIAAGAGLRKKDDAPTGGAAPKKKAGDKKEDTAAVEAYECDQEVVGVVVSAIEGSEETQAQLKQGAGTIAYKSEVKSEVASMIAAANEHIAVKMKRAATRDNALRTVRSLLWNPPAVLPSLSTVLMLLDEPKLKTEPGGKATDLCLQLSLAGPRGKAVPELVLPVILAHMGAAAAGKWQVKVGTMKLLKEVMLRMGQPGCCPKQLGMLMPKVMSALRDAVGDARKEVKKEAETFLLSMGKEMVQNPEIGAATEEIVGSIADSANMEKASAVLTMLGNTTFMNTVDSCAFGLIYPIVVRAMREKNHEAMMLGVKIVGASVVLIADPEYLQPYANELLPLLKECLMHPTAQIQREASKSFGSLAYGLPSLCEEDIYPWLLEKLQSQETNDDVSEVERRGAAQGLSEVLLARRDMYSPTLYKEVLARITGGKTKETRAGALTVFQFLAHLGPQAMLPHVTKCLPAILDALKEESEVVTKQAMSSLKVMVEEFGSAYPHLLLPRMQEALFFEGEAARDLAMQSFMVFVEKVWDAVGFGKDLLTMDGLSVTNRHSLICSLFMSRNDSTHEVRRMATLLWKEKLQSGPKTKGEILPHLLRVLKRLEQSGKPGRVAIAKACLKELTTAGDVTEAAFAEVQAADEVAPAAAVEEMEEALPPPLPRGQLLERRSREELAALNFAAPMKAYVEAVVVSCCVEAPTKAAAIEAAEEELAPLATPQQRGALGSAVAVFALQALFDKVFDGVADEVASGPTGADAGDYLVHVRNLMMMYGGGHLLLKNTTLELKKGRRYGVVGRNGAGKTTLMSSIASGGVKEIPSHLKTLHVKPEALMAASNLTATQFCRKDMDTMAPDEVLEKALGAVGFPKDMQAKQVSELSGGWRMKLLLASAMMRDCDLLLLDEPTNHLDKESVAWLAQYLCSLTHASLMVISHDPHFLNAVCTDIIQYSASKTLEYFEGNFDDFRKARSITSDEEAEALLLGNDYDEKEAKAAAGEVVEGDDDDEEGGVTAGLLDKNSKITFPIPGKLPGHSSARPVMELQNVNFAYNEEEGPMILNNVSCKIGLSSRVGIVGANGAGKSTLLNLLCGELMPCSGPGGQQPGEVVKHRNLRLAYIAQHHMYHLAEFVNSTPYIYIQRRFKEGWDEALQKRLIEPANEEEAKERKELGVKYGKYGNEIQEIVGRITRGKEVLYEVQWKGLDDPKQNTQVNLSKLKLLGVPGLGKAYDERVAAKAVGLDMRALSEREIVKHLEQFGLDEDMILNRQIGGFSAGQKSKLTLGAAFWIKPHVVALDEPTNYIDMETLDALAKGLGRFKGGVVVISHSSDFVERVCNETWLVEGNTIAERSKKEDKDTK